MSEPPLVGPDEPAAQSREAPLTVQQRALLALGVLALMALIVGAVVAVIAMVRHPAETETIRDVFIIFMALESLVIGLALVTLIVQLARLTNLLQNEIRPILDSTNETLNTLRGTTRFLSDNLVEPVVKVNSSVAALRRFFDLFRFGRGK
jgi:hypothetical protein